MAGRKTTAVGFDDPYPRQRPPEKEEPPNWRMAALYAEQALQALKYPEKDTPIRDNAAHNLKLALEALYPKPLDP